MLVTLLFSFFLFFQFFLSKRRDIYRFIFHFTFMATKTNSKLSKQSSILAMLLLCYSRSAEESFPGRHLNFDWRIIHHFNFFQSVLAIYERCRAVCCRCYIRTSAAGKKRKNKDIVTATFHFQHHNIMTVTNASASLFKLSMPLPQSYVLSMSQPLLFLYSSTHGFRWRPMNDAVVQWCCSSVFILIYSNGYLPKPRPDLLSRHWPVFSLSCNAMRWL